MKTKFFFLIIIIFSLSFSFSCEKGNTNQKVIDSLAFTADEISLIKSNSEDTAMKIMNLFLYPDTLILRKISHQIGLEDTVTLNYLIKRMYKTVVNIGVGIAAPQVGINRRIIWVQRQDRGSPINRPFEAYINPRIIALSDTIKSRGDGCLSIPGIDDKNSLRAIWVLIEYQKKDGTWVTEKITNQYTAHIFQHEIDHLDGIVFLDRLAKKNEKIVIIDE